MDKYQLMIETSVKQEGSVIANISVRMYSSRPESRRVQMLMVVPIVQVTELIAKMDEGRATYFSMN